MTKLIKKAEEKDAVIKKAVTSFLKGNQEGNQEKPILRTIKIEIDADKIAPPIEIINFIRFRFPDTALRSVARSYVEKRRRWLVTINLNGEGGEGGKMRRLVRFLRRFRNQWSIHRNWASLWEIIKMAWIQTKRRKNDQT